MTLSLFLFRFNYLFLFYTVKYFLSSVFTHHCNLLRSSDSESWCFSSNLSHSPSIHPHLQIAWTPEPDFVGLNPNPTVELAMCLGHVI